MGEEPFKDYADELEGQMRAAGALIESLEEEVASLRRDLDQASVALKAAQEEVAAREQALQEKERARAAAEKQAEHLRETATELRIKSSDEQLDLTNRHISELASLQDRFYGQRREEIEAALADRDSEALKAEYRKLQEAAKHHYEQRISVLENAYREAREKLRAGERDLEERRAAELETLKREVEEQRRSFDRKLREYAETWLEEERRSSASRHQAELEALRAAFAEQKQEIRKEHESVLEDQRARFEARREELAEKLRQTEEQRQTELREIKSLAETREQELRRSQSARVAEVRAEADRRVSALQAQREADNKALQARYEEDVNRLKEKLERANRENQALKEELEKLELEGTSEADDTPQAAASREPEPRLQQRVSELEAALARSEEARRNLEKELEGLRDRVGRADVLAPRPAQEEDVTRPDDERVRELEAHLRDAREESRRNAGELERMRERLRRLSEPEHLLRAGIEAFNESEHTRHVASISKALGQPKVHAGVEGDPPTKPVFTFVWKDLAWRRYLSEPVEGLTGPRVYLVGSGENPEELESLSLGPNARVDARGRLILGVQAR